MPRLNGDLPWKNANKTCWASSSFRVFFDDSNESSGVEWLGWFGPQKWSPSDVHQKVHPHSVPIYSISHTSSYDILLVRIIEDLSFCGECCGIYSKREHSSYNSHAFLVGFLRPWAPANNLNSLGLLKLILPALGVFRGCEVAFVESFRFAGREACKAPARANGKQEVRRAVVHVLPSGWHQRHFSEVLRVELMAYWTPPSKKSEKKLCLKVTKRHI